jgi:CRISPR-associated endonuclease/helicase Cas3
VERLNLSGDNRAAVRRLVHELHSLDDDQELNAHPSSRAIEVLTAALRDHLAHHRPDRQGEAPGPWTVARLHRVLDWLGTNRPQLVPVPDPTDPDGQQILQFHLAGGTLPLPNRPVGGLARDVLEPAIGDPFERDDEDPAASSITARPVTLADHHANVRRRARQIADALQLPPDLAAVVEDAAGWHDLGKTEPRFQVMLHGGDPYQAALATQPLAKSGMAPQDRPAWVAARRRSGLPPGARHEAWSAALVEEYLNQADPPYPGDTDLLIHLIASHHGHARPWLPLVVDPDPRPVEADIDGVRLKVSSANTVSLDQPARFARLNTRYGRWGLALLETVVRCADMTVSAEGS